jgi:hypothetical protein
MKWTKIDKEKLPKEEVLAGNFDIDSYGYGEKLIGNLYVNGNGNVTCDSDDTMLKHCTHYIDINHYDPDENDN